MDRSEAGSSASARRTTSFTRPAGTENTTCASSRFTTRATSPACTAVIGRSEHAGFQIVVSGEPDWAAAAGGQTLAFDTTAAKVGLAGEQLPQPVGRRPVRRRQRDQRLAGRAQDVGLGSLAVLDEGDQADAVSLAQVANQAPIADSRALTRRIGQLGREKEQRGHGV